MTNKFYRHFVIQSFGTLPEKNSETVKKCFNKVSHKGHLSGSSIVFFSYYSCTKNATSGKGHHTHRKLIQFEYSSKFPKRSTSVKILTTYYLSSSFFKNSMLNPFFPYLHISTWNYVLDRRGKNLGLKILYPRNNWSRYVNKIDI